MIPKGMQEELSKLVRLLTTESRKLFSLLVDRNTESRFTGFSWRLCIRKCFAKVASFEKTKLTIAVSNEDI